MYVQLKMYALCSIYLEATGYVRPTRVQRKLFLDILHCVAVESGLGQKYAFIKKSTIFIRSLRNFDKVS